MKTRYVLSCIALVAACNAEPTDDTHPTPSELSVAETERIQDAARLADAVFVGEVVRIDHQMSQADVDGQALPFTVVTWSVEDGIKGVDTDTTYSARFLGGPTPDGKTLSVSEIPEFALGDRDLLFITGNGDLGCPLVGGEQGRVPVLSDEAPLPLQMIDVIRDADLDVAEAAEVVDLEAPFVFTHLRAATPEQMEELQR